MNFNDFNKKLTQIKLGKMIHHLELYQHKHHHDLPPDMKLNKIKMSVSMIDIKSSNKKEALKSIDNDDIDNTIKYLKKLKTDVGLL